MLARFWPIRIGAILVSAALGAAGCGADPIAADEPREAFDPRAEGEHLPARGPTTDGAVAMHNLDARITQLEPRAAAGGIEDGVELAALYQLRAQVRGRLEDDERAIALGERLVTEHPDDGRAYLARAKTRSRFHRFREALADLDEAARRGEDVEVERATVHEATDGDDAALARLRGLAAQRPSFANTSALASALARRGLHEEAEAVHLRAYAEYRDVSPVIVAWLEFQHGLVHERRQDYVGAAAAWARAHDRLPEYSAAASHLAEVHAREGSIEIAKALFREAHARSGNPEYAGRLAALLDASDPERDAVLAEARTGFERLVARHPAAFADHAARFWLDAGADPARALALAQANIALRSTAEAHALLVEAALATDHVALACAHLPQIGPTAEALLGAELLQEARGACGE